MLDITLIILSFCIWFCLFITFFYYLTLISNLDKIKKEKKLEKYPFVSIIVPAYNEEENIANAIESLLNLDYPKDKLEIIVVDDGSKDRTYEIAKKYEEKYPGIVKVFKKPNGGKATAVNLGIKNAKGEFIVVLDADSIVERDALKKMLVYFDDPKVMAVVASLKVYKPRNWLEWFQYIEYIYFGTFLRKIFEFLDCIPVTPGPFSVYRREFFEKHGLFEEGNITEDNEMALRIHAYGYKIVHCPDAIVYTKVPSNFKSLLRQRLRWYLGNIENFSRYWPKISKVKPFFGKFMIPVFWIFIFIPVYYFSWLSWITFIKPFIKSLEYYFSINFDLLPEIFPKNFDLNATIETTKFTFLVSLTSALPITIVSLLATFFAIYFAEEITKSKFKLIPWILYAYLSPILYGLIWSVVIWYKIFGREYRWGNLVWRNSLINKILKCRQK